MPESSHNELSATKDVNDTPREPAQGLSVRNLYAGIFLTSAAVLLLQIALTRLFSFTIWYHFTYVTISLAMLGFGASGAVLASSEKLAGLDVGLARWTSIIGAVSVPIMMVIVSKVPFAPFDLPKESIQIVYMAIYYAAVTIPFFCAGMTISCAFRSIPQEATKIYFWDLTGAGAGCFAVVSAINLFGVPAVAALSAALFLLAAVTFLGRGPTLAKLALLAAALVWIPLGINIEKTLEFRPSKDKYLSRIQGKKMTFSKWSPIFRIDAFELPQIKGADMGPHGEVYGIDAKYIPPDASYAFIAHDGDACTMMMKSDENLTGQEMFEKSILKPPYLLLEEPKVLVIGPGGGVDVGMALKSNARSVLAVELDPVTIDLVSGKYNEYVGGLYNNPKVQVVIDEGRSFLRRSEERFDLIQMTGVDTLAALTSGAYVLAENYLYTLEAYREFLEHLTDDGILSIAIFDIHHELQFPRHTARQVSLSVETLTAMGIENPSRHIAVISMSAQAANIPHVIILTKKSPFTFSEIGTLRKFANELSFEFWHLPGEPADNPCAYIATSTEEQRKEYYKGHFFKLMAPTDDSPFFFHYYKWPSLLKRQEVDTGHTGATGQLILLVILIFSIIFSLILIILPLLRFQKAGLRTRWKWNYILYFAALGLGFIFIEISYIQRFILFLGYPTYSLTVILFSLLTFSGIGSYLSGRLPIKPATLIMSTLVLLALVTLGYTFVLPPIFDRFLGASKQVRIAISLVLLFPMGMLLGVFFPTGIKIVSAEDKRFVPWAWGINGCASVIGTVLSIIIAMSYGFSTVTTLAVVIYVVGVYAMSRACRESRAKSV